MINIGELKTKREDNKLVFSLETNPKKFGKMLAIIYLLIFGYIDLTLIIPSWVDGDATFVEVLIANGIFLSLSLLFIFISPILVKAMGKNVHKTTDFITLDKNTRKLYFRNEDIDFDLSTVKEIKLDENKSVFGLSYYLVVVTNDLEKRMMPPMHFKFAKEIKEELNKELHS